MARIKIYTILAFLIFEIFTHYFLPLNYNLAVKFIPSFLIVVFYTLEVRKNITLKDKLFIISFAFTIIGEYFFVFRASEIILILNILIYIIEHQLYISTFREEKAVILGIENQNYFKKGLPYILLSFLFFGSILMGNVPDNYFIFVLLYCIQVAILGTLSILRPKQIAGYNMVLAGIFLNVISDALSSIHLFVETFQADYAIIRITFILSKLLLALGLLKSRNINLWDTEYK